MALAVLPVACLSAYYAHGNDATRLLLEISPLIFIAAVGVSLAPVFRAEATKQRIGWRTFLPALIVVVATPVLAFPIALSVGKIFADWRFSSCEALVRRIESNEIPVSTNVVLIPLKQAQVRLCNDVVTQRFHDVLVIEFNTDVRGFPAHTSGYIFSSGDSIPKGSFAGRRLTAQIRPHWFYFAQ